jgi:8-oxo-dGTP pyrophosphatase MutT (NUDIX family)
MAEAPTHAGIAVQAADTGRVLMIQRSLDPTDPPEVQGTWEFPGGSLENGESPEDGAWREFCEETGLPKPKGETVTSWTSPDGVYQGFVHVVPVEATAFDELNPDRQAASTVNPDDPKGERPEVTAWFDPEHVRNLGAALRPEVADMDWSVFDRGNPTTESWQALTAFHQLFETLPVTQQILAAQLVEGAPGHGNEARLKRWWLTSSGIHWGVGGDFDSCVRKATDIFGRHGVAIDPKRWCAALHKEFTGASPGHAPGEHHESAEETPMGDDDLRLVETVTITESAAQEARATGEFPIQFITPGWGSSGYYSPQTIAEAASERVIPKGTHMYADHPTDAEFKARPARSIKDLMAVTTEDARLSPTGALVGRAKVVPGWQPFVEAVAPHIGVSIRGEAKDIREGVAEGRKGRIIEGLRPPVASVDFVTKAGRGGRVLELLESAATEDVDIREDLDVALYEAKYDAEQLRKMAGNGQAMKNPAGDPAYPIADETDLRNAIHAVGRGSGDHTAIRAHIVKRAKALGYSSLIPDDWSTSTSEDAPTDVPATRPGDKKEAQMGMKEIEESEYTRLTEQAGRVTTLEAALSKTQTELTEAKAALVPNKDLRDALARVVTENATLRAREVAVPLISEALEDALIGESAKKRIGGELLEGIRLKESDDGKVLDSDALTEAINDKVRVAEAEAQELREAMGVGQIGRPRGLGAKSGGGLLVEQKLGEYTDTTADALSKAFGLSEASAKTAATGR